jgi:hypothetical protein
MRIAVALGIALSAIMAGVQPARAETLVSGIISTDTTWTLVGSPYVVTGFTRIFGAKLTIEPGVEVRVRSAVSGIEFVNGAELVANGTAAQRIRFVADSATQTPGYWGALTFSPGVTATLSMCDVTGAGSGDVAAVIIRSSAVQINTCKIDKASNDGVGIIDSGLRPRIVNTQILDVGGYPITQMHAGNPVFQNNTVSPGVSNALQLGGNTSGYTGGGLSVSVEDQVIDGSPEAFNGAGVYLPVSGQVEAGRALTITPGTTLRMGSAPSPDYKLRVFGRLLIAGTATRPVTVTSNTPTPVNSFWTPILADNAEAFLRARHCRISGGQLGALSITRNARADIQHCSFTSNQAGVAVNGQGAVVLRNNQFTGNTIGVENLGFVNGGPVVDARNNWWGDVSGPNNPAGNANGRGDPVSNGVLFDPWSQSPGDAVSFSPVRAGNVASTTVRFYGVQANPALAITLKRAGQPDIAGTYRGPAGDSGVDYTFALSGAVPGTGTFAAGGVAGAPAIPGSFEIISAPANAQAQAAQLVSVDVSAPRTIRPGRQVAVFVAFRNRGLVDSPPAEFRLITPPGVTFLPAPDASYVVAGFGEDNGQVASFMRRAVRPGADERVLLFVRASRGGELSFRADAVVSNAYAPVFANPPAMNVRLGVTLTNASATLLRGALTLDDGASPANGALTIENLGPVPAYSPPQLTIREAGPDSIIELTATLRAGGAMSALAQAQSGGQTGAIMRYVQRIQLPTAALQGIPNLGPELDGLSRQTRRVNAEVGCAIQRAGNTLTDDTRMSLNASARGGGMFGRVNEMVFNQASGLLRDALPALTVEVNTAHLNAMDDALRNAVASPPRAARAEQLRARDGVLFTIDTLCWPASNIVRFYLSLISVFSIDPNDKYGNTGAGPSRSIRSDETLSYAIAFENVPTATAPAQIVVISDTLDAATLDLLTLRIHGVTISDTVVQLGDARTPVSREIDLRATRGVLVRLDASLAGNTLVVTLTSLDPATGEPVTDALAGFLPANVNGTEGQGHVYFSIKPKPGLALGTVIRNKAVIVFDDNAAIETPVWFNTIGLRTMLPMVVR